MDVSTNIEEAKDENTDPAIAPGVRFLDAIFEESDTILLRPIETWTEEGKKRSQTDFGNTCHRKAAPTLLALTLVQLHRLAKQKRLNIFFGVCPRVGASGHFDQAWQIRIVRALWCDIDNITVDEALQHVAASGLPKPSIVVNSGNGVHLYWLLQEPFLIDDVDAPQAVLTEWIEEKDGRKRPRKYIEEADAKDRLYLDNRANIPQLSPKATYIQDILAGIASAIGGDHTHDLSRLLRVPGTLNRKNERNGRSPTVCELVACDKELKYPLEVFVKYANASPHKVQREKIAAVPLPHPKPLTPTRRDSLHALVTACAAANVGTRSEADWHLLCTAIEKGWPKHEIWQAVAGVGKFAEGGETYFETSWKKAEAHTREKIFSKAAAVAFTKRKEATSDTKRSQDQWDCDGAENDCAESDPGLVAILARSICEKEYFAQDDGGKLYHFRNGVYRSRGETLVKTRVKQICTKLDRLAEWSSHVANEVVEFIRVDSPLLWQRPPCDVINLKNGLLNLVTLQLATHSPNHLSTVQLPVAFDINAACPKIDRFISETFPADATTIAYEILAWLMSLNTSIQKAVLLVGPGGNGKSRYLRMVEAFLGKENVSNLSLHRLESDKFACARLFGKLANICPDLPSEHLTGTSIFKAITGGDPVTGEYKFKDSFDFIPFSRLVFSANNPPKAYDASDGFFDRWFVVPVERRFRGEGGEIPAETLDAMLSEPAEQSGLLNRALQVLPHLQSTGRFSVATSVEKAFSEFHAATDPLSVWLDRYTIEGPRLVTPKRLLMAAFNEYYERTGHSPLSERAFGSAFKRIRQDVNDAQRTVAGKVQWCYLGIGLASDSPSHLDGTAEPPMSLYPQGHPRDSRDSRDSFSINLSHPREKCSTNCESDIALEQDSENRVNRVNSVNGECRHEFVEGASGG